MTGQPEERAKPDRDRESEGPEEPRAPRRPLSVAMSWPRLPDDEISAEPPGANAA
jgi:hypothetical protein